MSLIAVLLSVGMFVGALACFLAPPRHVAAWPASMLVGVTGSVFGATMWAMRDPDREHPGYAIILGAVLAIALTITYHVLSRRRPVERISRA
jgi:uncharacterized membrane protein YeaQ/YmgE (transglycosylase-associated protein family)